jgi:hypothetical protein
MLGAFLFRLRELAPMRCTARIALAALVLWTGACASAPRPEPGEGLPGTGEVWIDLEMKNPLATHATDPSQVWFVRIGPLNGSDCLPRPHDFPDASTGPDPTCGRDDQGRPVWTPVFMKADRIEGTRAALVNPPPARYVVVAAVFPGRRKGTVTLYFSQTLIGRTEMPVPDGARRFMGSYRLRYGDWPFLDAAQSFVRARLAQDGAEAVAPNPASGLLGGLTNKDKPGKQVHRAARWDQLKPASPGGGEAEVPW